MRNSYSITHYSFTKAVIVDIAVHCSLIVALAGVIGAEKLQHQEINEALAVGQAQEVLVLFDESTVLQTAAALRKKAKAMHDTVAILEAKASMYKSLKQTVMNSMYINDIETLQDYSHLPIMFLKLKTMNGLQALLRHPSLIGLQE